jgi:RNA polymerase sigma-70 factor (ECF subfamily)
VAASDEDRSWAAFVAAAAPAWPTVSPPAPRAEIVERLAEPGIDLAELYIAAAIAEGSSAAVRAFEDRYFGGVRGSLRRAGAGRDEVDDLLQQLRLRLFVAPAGDDPSVIGYAGRGRLAGLVQIAAVRMLYNLRARREAPHPGDPDWVYSAIGADLAARPGRGAEHADIKQAFAAVTAALDRRTRLVLRLALVHRLTVDEIGAVLGCHRATAARQVAAAKASLVGAVRGQLADRWGDAALLDEIASSVDVSFERLLASAEVA